MPAAAAYEPIRAFYDDMAGGLLAGYVYGNPRVEAALRFVLARIPPDARRILDVGCGIGWSTQALKRLRPSADVIGIDVSKRLVGIARTLFADEGASFEVVDIGHGAAAIAPPFDVVVLMDVYEHVPLASRLAVHAVLNRLLSPDGGVLLTVPSASHQRFLRAERPQDLQPVDEDVSQPDLEQLATDIGGSLAHVEHVTVWRPDDYVHAAIVRGTTPGVTRAAITVPGQEQRTARVAERLRVRVTREGLLLPVRDGLKVCVIQPNCRSYSERLIHDHLERLPADVVMLCDGWFPEPREGPFPERQWNGERLLPWPLRAVRRAAYALTPRAATLARRIECWALAHYLRRERIDVVLAEYGPTGVAVAEACRRAGVPLVVHFHGFDAHHTLTIEQHRAGYRRLFAAAAAIVVVSRKMEAQLLVLGAPRTKVRYNASGVDTTRFAGADPSLAPPTFVSVGRFVDKKAPHLTLLAFAKVRASCPDARLIMLGDGHLLESARQLAEAVRIADAVEFRGARGHAEVAAALRGARAFVLHSVETRDGDSEGTPIALLEAAATGLPVIATRHAGIGEVVLEGEMGFLVAEGDVEGMAARMIELARSPELAGRLGARGRRHIAANYSIEKSVEGLWTIVTQGASEGRVSNPG